MKITLQVNVIKVIEKEVPLNVNFEAWCKEETNGMIAENEEAILRTVYDVNGCELWGEY